MKLFTLSLVRSVAFSCGIAIAGTSFLVAQQSSETGIKPQSPKHLKQYLQQQTVMFLGNQGEGANCPGLGMCRGTIIENPQALSKISRPTRSVLASGRFHVKDGNLQFILTNLASEESMSLNDVASFPIDYDTELPRDVARNLGFSGVKVYKSRYNATIPGVFPVHAKYSVGLAANVESSVATPKGMEYRVAASFEVLQAMNVSVVITNSSGERVATLFSETSVEGNENPYTLQWNGKNNNGKTVAAGAYNIEVRCTVKESGLSFAETVQVLLSPAINAQ